VQKVLLPWLFDYFCYEGNTKTLYKLNLQNGNLTLGTKLVAWALNQKSQERNTESPSFFIWVQETLMAFHLHPALSSFPSFSHWSLFSLFSTISLPSYHCLLRCLLRHIACSFKQVCPVFVISLNVLQASASTYCLGLGPPETGPEQGLEVF
jgi:hypothetical protein